MTASGGARRGSGRKPADRRELKTVRITATIPAEYYFRLLAESANNQKRRSGTKRYSSIKRRSGTKRYYSISKPLTTILDSHYNGGN
jgi:hypothetical protein